jgi:Zn-dependent protease
VNAVADRIGGYRVGDLLFTPAELRDLAVAWVALGVAFAVFRFGPARLLGDPSVAVVALGVSMATVGVGFLLHELAHKVVAVHYDQVAHFEADYGMLFLAVMAAVAGFLFAAPGAVVHRGRVTARQHGLIAVAGPVTNLLLVAAFAPLLLAGGVLTEVGRLGVVINAVLAAFNMIPFGPLDGKTVLAWSKPVFAGVLVAGVVLSYVAITRLGLF